MSSLPLVPVFCNLTLGLCSRPYIFCWIESEKDFWKLICKTSVLAPTGHQPAWWLNGWGKPCVGFPCLAARCQYVCVHIYCQTRRCCFCAESYALITVHPHMLIYNHYMKTNFGTCWNITMRFSTSLICPSLAVAGPPKLNFFLHFRLSLAYYLFLTSKTKLCSYFPILRHCAPLTHFCSVYFITSMDSWMENYYYCG